MKDLIIDRVKKNHNKNTKMPRFYFLFKGLFRFIIMARFLVKIRSQNSEDQRCKTKRGSK